MLVPCPACGCHVTSSACVCPHCDATLRRCEGKLATTAAAALMGLALVGCGDKDGIDQPEYGVPDTSWVDEDGDGWSTEDDCDDTNADIHPDATETPGDSIDSNCDGEDDT
ncbi:MAG: putative metal-binding motif-containing protein [Alphaproteobacteria bacterium]|nr:putative metal-binding motif-containing protein [Alphaproteobacteria bacterium]